MKLIGKKILIKVLKEVETKSGILLIESFNKKNKAEVVLTGNKVNHVKIGDIITIHDNVGTELYLEDEKHLIIHESYPNGLSDIISINS